MMAPWRALVGGSRGSSSSPSPSSSSSPPSPISRGARACPGSAPSFKPVPKFLGVKTPLTVDLKAARGGVASVDVRVVQGAASAVVAQQAFPAPPAEQRLDLAIAGRDLGLKEGAATIEVRARDGFWRPLRVGDQPIASVPVTIKFTPPTLEVLGATHYLHQGGGGLAVLRAKGAARVGRQGRLRLLPLVSRWRWRARRRALRPALEPARRGADHRLGRGRGRQWRVAPAAHRAEAAPLSLGHRGHFRQVPRVQVARAPARALLDPTRATSRGVSRRQPGQAEGGRGHQAPGRREARRRSRSGKARSSSRATRRSSRTSPRAARTATAARRSTPRSISASTSPRSRTAPSRPPIRASSPSPGRSPSTAMP